MRIEIISESDKEAFLLRCCTSPLSILNWLMCFSNSIQKSSAGRNISITLSLSIKVFLGNELVVLFIDLLNTFFAALIPNSRQIEYLMEFSGAPSPEEMGHLFKGIIEQLFLKYG
jgi:hypothetical protein